MTDDEWCTCADVEEMLKHLNGIDGISQRQRRLFGCACCRRIWHLITDSRFREAIEVAERFCEGLATEKDVDVARVTAHLAASRFTNKDIRQREGDVSKKELFAAIDTEACRRAALKKGLKKGGTDPKHPLWVAGKGLRAAAWACEGRTILAAKESRYVAWAFGEEFGRKEQADLLRQLVPKPTA